MLVIQRRKGEGVHVGERIFVKVLGVRGGRVKIGIEAPLDITIARDELMTLNYQQSDLAEENGDD